MYGAFETHWYQDFEEDQIWGFYGPGMKEFCDLYENHQVVPSAYAEWMETRIEPDFAGDGDFYPYLCAEVRFRGRWSEGCRECISDDDAIYVEEFLEIQIIDLESPECIPAFGSRMRDEWPVDARPRRMTSP